MKTHVGRMTTGITLVVFGVLILLSLTTDLDGLGWASKLWPLVLIGYGVEYLLAQRGGNKLRFDIAGALVVTVAFVGVIGFNFFTGFGIGERFEFHDESITIATENITSVYVSTHNGDVQVRPSTNNEISVKAYYHIPAISEAQALEKLKDYELVVDNTSSRLEAKVVHKRADWLGFMNVSVDVIVKMPKELILEAKTSNGRIDIQGMDNIKYAKTSNGRIVVADSSGKDAVLDTSNGRIEITRFIGSVDADTSNGRIVVADSTVTGDWKLSTSNGNVEVDLVGDHNYKYAFSTSNGRINATEPPFPDFDNDKKVHGTVGTGDHRLVIKTSNGKITVHVR